MPIIEKKKKKKAHSSTSCDEWYESNHSLRVRGHSQIHSPSKKMMVIITQKH